MQRAARVSKSTAFMDQGSLVELDRTEVLFTQPKEPPRNVTRRFD